MPTDEDIKSFSIEFRDGLIGTQPKASIGMCAMVSIPLQAALKVLLGVDTNIVTEEGHTFLVTSDSKFVIDPTIDQFKAGRDANEKVMIGSFNGKAYADERLSGFRFIEIMENFKRLQLGDGLIPTAKDAGLFVAQYIYIPLARQGFFEHRMH